jgi:hypothetical protein
MKKEELQQLIAECVIEVMQEQNMDEGFWDALKKQARGFGLIGPDADSGAAHYDRFAKMHGKKVDYKKTFDPKNVGKSGGKQSKMRAAARGNIENIRTKFETDLKKSMRDAFIEGEAVGMTREEIKKIFNSTILGVLNKYRRLEEEWGKKE